jgi:hypothetical protein
MQLGQRGTTVGAASEVVVGSSRHEVVILGGTMLGVWSRRSESG